jgi:endoglucanase
VNSLEDAFVESGTHVPTLLKALATSPHVRVRYDSPPEEGWDTPSPPLEIEIPSPPDGGIEVNDENLVVELVKVSEWENGYCSDVTVSNMGDYPIVWIIQLPILGTIDNLWNATMTPAGEKIQFEGPEWQQEVAAGDSYAFGFCASL